MNREEVIQLNATIIVEDIIKKTSANGWKNVSIGDKLNVVQSIKNNSGALNGYYQNYLTITNLRTGESFINSNNELVRYLTKNIKIKQEY